MSDDMLLAVLRMPREMREADMLSRRQFDGRVLEAADELESRAKRIAELEQDLLGYIEAAEADEANADDSINAMTDIFLKQTASIKNLEAKIELLEEQNSALSAENRSVQISNSAMIAKGENPISDCPYVWDESEVVLDMGFYVFRRHGTYYPLHRAVDFPGFYGMMWRSDNGQEIISTSPLIGHDPVAVCFRRSE
jgi:hypothetical protein